jgi:hypothetical protein
MQAAWPGLLGLEGHYDPREAVHGFFIAAHLGQWKVVQSIGQVLSAKSGGLDGFHRAALDNLATFDYASIFELTRVEQPWTTQWTLADRSFRINHLRLRIQKAESHSKVGATFIEGFSDPKRAVTKDADGWIPKEDPVVSLLQIGASAHWIEDVGQPPVSGFMDSSRLLLRGEVKNDKAKLIQVFDMHPIHEGSGSKWAGTCRMDLLVVADGLGSTPSATVFFEYQWEMSPDPLGQ